MPALLRPCAISASTSLSRGVRTRSGDSWLRVRASTRASTTLGSITEPPAATSAMA